MRNYFIYFAFSTIVLLSSCEKSVCGFKETESLYVGQWKWEESTGGIAGSIETPENTGTQICYEIFDDGTFIKSGNKIASIQGQFTIGSKYCIHSNQIKSTIKFDTQSELTIESNDSITLYLADENVDGFTYKYTK